MLSFLKYVFATIVGLFLSLLLFVVIIVGIISSTTDKKDDTKVGKNSVLKINLNRVIEERETDNFLSDITNPFSQREGSLGLLELRQSIERAANDENVKGIFLEVANTAAGMATLQELRNALKDFKKSGKFIVAYGESYSEASYYLASVADKIFLPPPGLLELNGLEYEILFFKGTLDKLDLKPEVFKVGEFKSAVEPFILEKMSDPNKLQLSSFLNSIYNHLLADISESRKISVERLTLISDSMLVRNSDDALRENLVTDLGYIDNVDDFIKGKLKISKDDEVNYVSLQSYQNSATQGEDTSNDIAVIYATGGIESGKGDVGTIGSETLAKELRRARKDDKVKAVVLRINSPGGSALASDIIWREVVLTKQIKPIIASMSDVAASGGYYIAMACDTIVAQPTTITGSIGVFGLLLNAQDFLRNKLGITTDIVKTGEYSDLGTFTRPLSSYEKKVIQNEVERIYLDFTTKAAKGRSLSLEQIQSVASGRVWSGSEAEKNKLVDVFGGLKTAIELAVKRAKLGDSYSIGYFPKEKNFFLKQLMQQLSEEEQLEIFQSTFGRFTPYVRQLKDINKLEGIQARMPYEIIIR